MSTRAIIGAAQSSPGQVGVRGVYHHSDGYPSGLGAYLFRLIRYQYGGNVKRAYAAIVGDHPAGWSHLFPLPGSPCNSSPEDYSDPRSPLARSKCYCHDRKNPEPASVCSTFPGEDDGGTEWAYGLNPISNTMRVMVCGYGWHQVALVDLDGPEPDWIKMMDEDKDDDGSPSWVDEFFPRVTDTLNASPVEIREFTYNGCLFVVGAA